MKAAGFAMLALAVLVVYEAYKHFTSSTGVTQLNATVPSANTVASGAIPSNWLTGLARSESPSALAGDFSFGAFGLQCGAGQGVTSQCTPPIAGGGGDVASYDLFSNWTQATQGLTAWINRNAPSAWGFAQQGNCVGFFQALQQGGYGGTADWPSRVCGLSG